MKKRGVVTIVAAGTLAGAIALEARTTARASVTGVAAARLAELGLDAEGIPVPSTLSASTDEIVLQYDSDVDVTELAAQWTTGLDNGGYTKSEDHSESESRYVFEFEQADHDYVVVVFEGPEGPIVAMAQVMDAAQHWAIKASSAPPAVLLGIW